MQYFEIELFLLNMGIATFLKPTIKKYFYHINQIKNIKLQAVQLLEAILSSSTSRQIPFD